MAAQETKVWTAARVRDELPDVKIDFNGRIYPAIVRGRLCEFAGVIVPETGLRCDVAWETVAHCLNANRPILY